MADMGRRLATLWEAHARFDAAETAAHGKPDTRAKRRAGAARDAVFAEINAVSTVMLSRPVETLADALAAALVAWTVAESMAVGSAAENAGLLVEAKQLRHVLAGIAIALAEAGAGDLEAYGASDLGLLRLNAPGGAL